MAQPVTPKKQASLATLAQQPTPPATQEPVATVSSHISEEQLPSPPRDDISDDLDFADTEATKVRGPLVTGRVSYCTETASPLPHTHYSPSIATGGTEDLEIEYSELGNIGSDTEQHLEQPTEQNIKDWLKSSKDRAQHKRRFDSLLHSFWPSNDEFNAARHQDYDPEEHGIWYDDYFKDQWEGGQCPFDNDDYNPLTDPSKSTEVWEPKIGEEGIEDERDLCMVLQARQNHRVLSEAHRQFRACGGYTMLVSSETMSTSNYEEAASIEDPASAVQLEFPLSTSNSSNSTNLSIEPAEVPCVPKAKQQRRLPMIDKKNKKRRKSKNTRKHRGINEDPNGAYKYESSDNEQPTYKKGRKNNVKTISKSEWKAQTRAAAQRQNR
ncbi:hypothetical protein NPX13_g7870 [Xylaria arbuscula]|uniref:Uncharacterized protein n=1 Tax=Xylaria arbuscula TaxID=114810 RepID=A0A9W8N971_9PEZI|nr:hypothetical protein NPX13_g7870 [Xylaria arbuscula]